MSSSWIDQLWSQRPFLIRTKALRFFSLLLLVFLLVASVRYIQYRRNHVQVYVIKQDNSLVRVEDFHQTPISIINEPETDSSTLVDRIQYFPKLKIPTSLQTPPNKPTPLCFIASWGQGPLPQYAYSMFESVADNHDYVKLFLFYHKTTHLPTRQQQQERYTNIHFIDLSTLAADKSYEKGGFPRFLTDRICQLFKEKKRYSLECEQLYSSMLFLENKPKEAPPIVQFRGMFGDIFHDFVNPSVCDAWAWIDLDVLVGNVKGWLDNNRLVWATDIFTVAAMDWNNLYTRGQMTVHNQRRRPQQVNSAWRQCKYFKSVKAISSSLTKQALCLDEGCYGDAVLKSNVTFGLFPWQGNSWDSRNTKYTLLMNNTLWVVKGCKTKQECRRQILTKIDHVAQQDLLLEQKVLSGSVITNEMLQTGTSTENQLSSIQVTRKVLVVWKEQCMWWIEPSFKNCIKYPHLPEKVKKGEATWAIIIRPHLKTEMLVWDLGPRVGLLKDYAASELLLYHFTHWKKDTEFEEFGHDKRDAAFIELSQLPEE